MMRTAQSSRPAKSVLPVATEQRPDVDHQTSKNRFEEMSRQYESECATRQNKNA
jgi:hypothetical protein